MSEQHWLGFWLEMMASRASSGTFCPSSMNSAHWSRRHISSGLAAEESDRAERAYRVQVRPLLLRRVFVLDDSFEVRQLVFNLPTHKSFRTGSGGRLLAAASRSQAGLHHACRFTTSGRLKVTEGKFTPAPGSTLRVAQCVLAAFLDTLQIQTFPQTLHVTCCNRQNQ